MGLISLIKNVAGTTFDSISSQIQDQYLEFFTQDSLGQDILVKKGANKMEKGRNKGNSEVISNGSVINVPEGCFCLLVNNGEIVDVVSDAGAYKWDTSTAPSIEPYEDGRRDSAAAESLLRKQARDDESELRYTFTRTLRRP